MESVNLKAPWLDLPQHLTELILERLPIPDYARFSAVCSRWRSVQRDHRLRQGSMLRLPWRCFFPQRVQDPDLAVLCYDPPQHRLRRFPVPDALALVNKTLIGCSHGWLILSILSSKPFNPEVLTLFNPITGRHLHLPPLDPEQLSGGFVPVLSSPPVGPDSLLMIHTTTQVLLWRVGDLGWSRFPLPRHFIDDRDKSVSNVVSCGGKFYSLCYDNNLLVFDPALQEPAVQLLDMDGSHAPSSKFWRRFGPRFDHLVESNGELLLVHLFFAHRRGLQRAQAFKADLVKKMWARVESLGKHAIIISSHCSLSLLASDSEVSENCIYSHNSSPRRFIVKRRWHLYALRGYHLGCRKMIAGPHLPDIHLQENGEFFLNAYSLWMLPSLAAFPLNTKEK